MCKTEEKKNVRKEINPKNDYTWKHGRGHSGGPGAQEAWEGARPQSHCAASLGRPILPSDMARSPASSRGGVLLRVDIFPPECKPQRQAPSLLYPKNPKPCLHTVGA